MSAQGVCHFSFRFKKPIQKPFRQLIALPVRKLPTEICVENSQLEAITGKEKAPAIYNQRLEHKKPAGCECAPTPG
jgi:hypothetical protein